MLWGEMVRAATIVIIIYFIKLNKLTLQTLLFSWNLYGSRATSVRFPQKQPYQTLLELPPFTKFGKACCYFVFYWEIISPISWAHQGGVPPLSPSPRVGPRRSPPPKSWPLFCGNSFLIPPPAGRFTEIATVERWWDYTPSPKLLSEAILRLLCAVIRAMIVYNIYQQKVRFICGPTPINPLAKQIHW
jgi:hypothetical protein